MNMMTITDFVDKYCKTADALCRKGNAFCEFYVPETAACKHPENPMLKQR
jgi:hypothetical protein